MSILDIIQPNNEFLRLVGSITIGMTKLEWEIFYFLAFLTNPRDQNAAQISITGLSFHRKIDAVRTLFRQSVADPLITKELDRLLDESTKLQEHRSTIVHASWSTYAKMDFARRRDVKIHSKKGYLVEFKMIPLSDLRKLSAQIEDITNQISKIAFDFWNEHATP